MIPIRMLHGLPFTIVTLSYGETEVIFEQVLIDSGSAGSLFDVEQLAAVDITPTPSDRIRTMRGVGGREYVVEKQIDQIALGRLVWRKPVVQIGSVDYGTPMDGILGADFLLAVGATLDFDALEIR
ncbi:MAG: retropepsin-like aspartic protease [Chloroflexota bacterium]